MLETALMDAERDPLLPSSSDPSAVRVFFLIPNIKADVIKTIDSPLSSKQLNKADVNFTILRPLVFKYARLNNTAVVYACLVVRSYFISQTGELALASLMHSRAAFCEILATKLLKHFASDRIELVSVLTTAWNPLAGATSEIIERVKNAVGGDDDDVDYPQSAIEMAISTEAKELLSSPMSQQVVNDIYSGRVVFTVAANRSILADNYKPRAIEIYDYRKAPFLDHYRLRVPRYGAILEFFHLALLIVTFVLCLANQDLEHINPTEILFLVFASAFVLKEYSASMEYGWGIYIANMWNAFDASFIVVYFLYLGYRIKGLVSEDTNDSALGFDILSCGACILFPRLVFFVISHNVVILSLRVMITQFVFFITIAAVCFSGLLFTLWTLGSRTWTVKKIAWLLVQVWFGNTYLSFGQAESFHPVFGPILMTGFAALSNTLLLTILISILSNTVARIETHANQEYLYQFAITTTEGVKSDALFSYQPPFNILALLILKPASWVVSPRTLHSLNVFLIKLFSFPILFVIAIYERHLADGQKFRESGTRAAQSFFNRLPKPIKDIPLLDAIVGSGSSDLYEAIFDLDMADDSELFENWDEERSPARTMPNARDEPNAPSDANKGSIHVSTPVESPVRPRLRNLSSISEGGRGRPPASPLARLFDHRPFAENRVHPNRASHPDLKGVTPQELRDQLKEMQERQTRIENLLIQLNRND